MAERGTRILILFLVIIIFAAFWVMWNFDFEYGVKAVVFGVAVGVLAIALWVKSR